MIDEKILIQKLEHDKEGITDIMRKKRRCLSADMYGYYMDLLIKYVKGLVVEDERWKK